MQRVRLYCKRDPGRKYQQLSDISRCEYEINLAVPPEMEE